MKNTSNDAKLSHQATGRKRSGTIWLYSFNQWGLEQADRYIRSMISRFSWLAENPQLGKQRDDIKPGYYCFPEGRHVIFYTITKSGIDIIGIPHQCMDIMSHFE